MVLMNWISFTWTRGRILSEPPAVGVGISPTSPLSDDSVKDSMTEILQGNSVRASAPCDLKRTCEAYAHSNGCHQKLTAPLYRVGRKQVEIERPTYRTDMTLGRKLFIVRFAQFLKTNCQHLPEMSNNRNSVVLKIILIIIFLNILPGKIAF
jgi:hypothetical protein